MIPALPLQPVQPACPAAPEGLTLMLASRSFATTKTNTNANITAATPPTTATINHHPHHHCRRHHHRHRPPEGLTLACVTQSFSRQNPQQHRHHRHHPISLGHYFTARLPGRT